MNKQNTLLVETAWETCNKVGGIYTVIRTKAASAVEIWKNNYCLIGPLINNDYENEFDEVVDDSNIFYKTTKKLNSIGIEAKFGCWLIEGRPTVVLINPTSLQDKLDELKYKNWKDHNISFTDSTKLIDNVLLFSEVVTEFFKILSNEYSGKILAHFHEWMTGLTIPHIRKSDLNVGTIFTTHATILGRYLAMNDINFYNNIDKYDLIHEAFKYRIGIEYAIERASAHGAHTFTTVSKITARECKYLLGREVDEITPNGIKLKNFNTHSESYNLHKKYKKKIDNFIMSHFFPSYGMDLNKTLYFVTSGRYEYSNKGFDITLEALARLNHILKDNNIDINIVMFFITKAPYHNINPDTLHSKASLHEIKNTINEIKQLIADKLFYDAAYSNNHKLPDLNKFVDDYWKLQYRQKSQSFKSDKLPAVVTHNLVDNDNDPILNFVRQANLLNYQNDKVKIVYHPDFINITNPLFGLDYNQFIRGTDLGIFPSKYEPWGYTPVECLASGVPAITSSLSGFGNYVKRLIGDDLMRTGIGIVDNDNNDFNDTVNQLVSLMLKYINSEQRTKIDLKNKSENTASKFSWKNLIHSYTKVYLKTYSIKYNISINEIEDKIKIKV